MVGIYLSQFARNVISYCLNNKKNRVSGGYLLLFAILLQTIKSQNVIRKIDVLLFFFLILLINFNTNFNIIPVI